MKNLLRVDYHIHTSFSDGQPSYSQVIDRAKELKMDAIAITDHYDRYDKNLDMKGLTDASLLSFFEMVREYADKVNQRVLCGIETCTDFVGNLRISDRVLYNSDIIITSPHYVEYDGEVIPGNFYDKRYWERYKTKVLNMASGPGDILGHCEAYLPFGEMLVKNTTSYEERQALAKDIAERYFDDAYIEELAKTLKKSGKALELHCITGTPRECVIKKAVEYGVKMSLGSDSHELKGVGNIQWGIEVLEKYGGESLQFIKS